MTIGGVSNLNSWLAQLNATTSTSSIQSDITSTSAVRPDAPPLAPPTPPAGGDIVIDDQFVIFGLGVERPADKFQQPRAGTGRQHGLLADHDEQFPEHAGERYAGCLTGWPTPEGTGLASGMALGRGWTAQEAGNADGEQRQNAWRQGRVLDDIADACGANVRGIASLATSSLGVGMHPITASFKGYVPFGSSTSPVLSEVLRFHLIPLPPPQG